MKIVPHYNRAILTKYDQPLPRYTSYPTALKFTETFSEADFRQAMNREGRSEDDWSLYFHIPFCRSPCFYCACSRIITRDEKRSQAYLDAIFREVALTAGSLPDSGRRVSQIHLGGGTPTFLSPEQLSQLWGTITQYFDLDKQGEYSIEIDPRAADIDTIELLAQLGFNRMSFGVQDLDPQVQKAVNRIQSATQTFEQIEAVKNAGVHSINVDLIYGLPKQTIATFSRTIERVIQARPERVAVYGYAHMPKLFKAQRQIDRYALPALPEKLELLEVAINAFLKAGYEYIGLDHFALPSDELAKARKAGTLQRNFQGYSTRNRLDMLGFGVTSIGRIGDVYYQNSKLENQYIERVSEGKLPLQKGYVSNRDDVIRRDIIMELMCQGCVDLEAFEARASCRFQDYFRESMDELRAFEADGLVELQPARLKVTPLGQLLLRNIANIFDAYRSPQSLPDIPLRVAGR